MLDNWSLTTLGEVAHVEMGQSPPSAFVSEREVGLAFLQGNAEFSDLHPQPKLWCRKPSKTALAGDALISVRAPVGALNRADQDYCIGRGLAAIRFGTVDPQFGYHALGLYAKALRKVAQGTTFEAVGGTELRQLEFPDAPPAEQRRIAEILDTMDEAIRRTEQVIAKLQQMKQGLVHDLLTRGIDDNGELRDPERHPEKFEGSTLGQKPKSWDVSSVAAEFAVDSGITLGPHRRPRHHPKPYLRVANVYRDRLDLSDIAYLEASPTELVSKTLLAGDLLVVEGHANPSEIGRCAMATLAVEGFTFQNHLFRLRPTSLDFLFSLHWMNGRKTREYWRRMCSTSSGLYTINRTLLSDVPIAVPSPDEQRNIVRMISSIIERIDREQAEAKKLRSLKLGLKDDLLTGRIRSLPS